MTHFSKWSLGSVLIGSLLSSSCIDPYQSPDHYSYFLFEGEQALCNDVDFNLDEVENKNFTCVEPIYMSHDAFRSSAVIDLVDPKPIEQTGKVYGYEDYLYTIDHQNGIGIWDLAFENTVQIGYIEVPGVSDISIVGRNAVGDEPASAHLYANSYSDLVQINLMDFTQSPIRVPDVFAIKKEDTIPELPQAYYFNYSQVSEENGYIIGYREDDSSDIVYFGE